jgi:hypothetical protein
MSRSCALERDELRVRRRFGTTLRSNKILMGGRLSTDAWPPVVPRITLAQISKHMHTFIIY